MASKAKAKTLTDDFDDDEVVSMLSIGTPSPGDPEQWLRDANNDLDWSYTARTLRTWSQDALLSHLWDKSFSIPPRDYNPSAPFVWVQLASGDTVTLPHGYRLPLMFVAKYRWEMTHSKIVNERQWKQERSNLFHLSRLCENLFRRAQVKASRGGMEKGWRCVMFDRLLARFYKHWARNDPEGGKGFLTTHGAKEYDRDVLKHDWKRWCLRGLNGVKMTEDEVSNGITIEQFRKTLKKREDGIWTIDDQPLTHITAEDPPDYSSSSELTEYSMDSDDNSSDANSDSDDLQGDSDLEMNDATGAPEPSKRPRELLLDVDEVERAAKRNRIEQIYANDTAMEAERAANRTRIPNGTPVDGDQAGKRNQLDQVSTNPIVVTSPHRSITAFPLSRTLAAMARSSVWAHTQHPDWISPSSPPVQNSFANFVMPSTSANTSNPSGSDRRADSANIDVHGTPAPSDLSAAAGVPTPSTVLPHNSTHAPSPSPANDTATNSTLPPPPPSSFLSQAVASTSQLPDRATSSTEAMPPRRAMARIRTRMPAPTFPDGYDAPLVPTPARTRRSAPRRSGQPVPPARTRAFVGSNPATATSSTPRPAAPGIASTTTGEPPAPSPQTQGNQSTMHITALELLEKLVDVKRVLQEKFPFTSSPLEAAAAAVEAAAGTPAESELDLLGRSTAASRGAGERVDLEKANEEKAALEAKLVNFEGQFVAIKEELKGILARLQVLEEGAAPNMAAVVAVEALAIAQPQGGQEQENSNNDDHPMEQDGGPEVDQDSPPLGEDRRTPLQRDVDENPETGTEGANAGMDFETVKDSEGSEAVERTNDVVINGINVDGAQMSEGGLPGLAAPANDGKQSQSQENSRPHSKQPSPEAGARQPTPLDDTRQPSHSEELVPQQPPPGSSRHTPHIDLRALDHDPNSHKHATSEPDTDVTMANTTTTTSTSPSTLINETSDPRVRDMSSNLNLLVDSLVSAKMLAVMEGMVHNRLKDRESEKEKDKASMNEGSIASSSGEAERERDLHAPPPPHPLTSDTMSLTQSAEATTLASLLGELRSIKHEARMREQRAKDDLQAMRELHSAEVDALRRRLSYLEQNRHAESAGPAPGRYRASPPPSRAPAHAESSYHAHHHGHAPLPSPATHMANGHFSFEGGRGHAAPSPVENDAAAKPPVRIYTDRSFGFTRSSNDDEAPLPIKTQRKQHMVFPARTQFG